MAPRTPTIIGWAGFDGGLKRAVSFAKVNREPEDDPIPKPRICHDLYGDFLDAVISGIIICPACYTLSGNDYKFEFVSGINGSHSTEWDGGAWRNNNIGQVKITQYPSSNGTCAGTGVEDTGNVSLEIDCTGDNVLLVNIAVSANGLATGLFFNDAGVIEEDIPNQIDIGGCGSGVFGAASGYDGMVTIALP